MSFDFAKSMQETSDTELIKILTIGRDDYQPEAIKAAEAELAKRNLTIEQISSVKKINEEEKAISDAKANTPLDFPWVILAVLFPGLFQLIISGIFKANGYDRKANELTKWTFVGIGFYFLLIILRVSGCEII